MVDKIFFGSTLKKSQIFGIFLCIVGIAMLSFRSSPSPTPAASAVGKEPISVLIPVLFGIITPFVFTVSNILVKYQSVKGGFSPISYSFNSIGCANTFILAYSIWSHLTKGDFDSTCFWQGLMSGILEAAGKVCAIYSCVIGFIGPSQAICNLGGVWLVVVLCI
jgi:drug/metabolite transporter (DMT)-like permease